jgi:hypothetical protein
MSSIIDDLSENETKRESNNIMNTGGYLEPKSQRPVEVDEAAMKEILMASQYDGRVDKIGHNEKSKGYHSS